jgi:hypothetical protein
MCANCNALRTRQDQPPVVSVACNERPLVMERKVVRGLADSGIMPPMKYWEMVADKLSAAGWSWGYCSAVTKDGWRWIVDAHREGRRYIVLPDELLSALLESEATLRERRSQEVRFVLDHRYNFIHSNPEYARNR